MKIYVRQFDERDYEKERKDAKTKNLEKRKALEKKIDDGFEQYSRSLKIEKDTLKNMVASQIRTGIHPNKKAADHIWKGKIDFTDVDFGAQQLLDDKKITKEDLNYYKKLASALGKLDDLKQKLKKLK